jgi:hypothetical protein
MEFSVFRLKFKDIVMFIGIRKRNLSQPDFGKRNRFSVSRGSLSGVWLWLPEHFHLLSYFDMLKIDIGL